jgi:hypothetical protein
MSRSSRRLSSTIAAALAIGALAAPAANALTGEEFRADTASQSTPAVGSSYSGSGLHSTSAVGSSNSAAPTVTRTTADEGFDLGSAAIGAGSAAAVLMLGAAGATIVTRRRRVRLAS